MVAGGGVAAHAYRPITFSGAPTLTISSDGLTVSRSGAYTYSDPDGIMFAWGSYVVACDNPVTASTAFVPNPINNCVSIYDSTNSVALNSTGQGLTATSTITNPASTGNSNPLLVLTGKHLAIETNMQDLLGGSYFHYSASVAWSDGSVPQQSSVSTPVVQAPVFNQPKFAMPSKIEVDGTGKVKLSGKDMGVSSVAVGGKAQKIDLNTDEKLEFDTTGLTAGVHDLVMKGGFGTYTVQKAIQVGEAVVTKVAAVSARQVAMAGGELSISGQGLEGTSQITMNGQILEIISKSDSKVTFKVPASTVASINDIMIEGSFVPVIFKKAFSYNR